LRKSPLWDHGIASAPQARNREAIALSSTQSNGAHRTAISDAVKVAELVTGNVSRFRWPVVNKNLRIV
jgi:hypothetical protein